MSPKIALITGASRGFGAAMAEGLAAAGYHVLALARTVGALEELDDRIQATGGSATLVPLISTIKPGWNACAFRFMNAGAGLICGCIQRFLRGLCRRLAIFLTRTGTKRLPPIFAPRSN